MPSIPVCPYSSIFLSRCLSLCIYLKIYRPRNGCPCPRHRLLNQRRARHGQGCLCSELEIKIAPSRVQRFADSPWIPKIGTVMVPFLRGLVRVEASSSSLARSAAVRSLGASLHAATPRPGMRSLCAMMRCGVPWNRCPQSGHKYLLEPLLRSKTTTKYSARFMGLMAGISHPSFELQRLHTSSFVFLSGHAQMVLYKTFSSTFGFLAAPWPALSSLPVPCFPLSQVSPVHQGVAEATATRQGVRGRQRLGRAAETATSRARRPLGVHLRARTGERANCFHFTQGDTRLRRMSSLFFSIFFFARAPHN